MISPVVIWWSVKRDYERLDRLADSHECYPFETCTFDLNGDGTLDHVEISSEPTELDRYHSRLKVFVSPSQPDPALNVEYVHVDGTFRTHLAYLEEAGVKKIVLYDTLNPQQFFSWNGSELVSSTSPTYLETQIRDAMALRDDTGGFNTRIGFDLVIGSLCIAYYLLLIFVTCAYLVWRRKRLS